MDLLRDKFLFAVRAYKTRIRDAYPQPIHDRNPRGARAEYPSNAPENPKSEVFRGSKYLANLFDFDSEAQISPLELGLVFSGKIQEGTEPSAIVRRVNLQENMSDP
mmetsp:Transcript_5833/g.10316  ORF Transcript_5833/g.10316 Transcript_5833/m.10316 type:complete len:106 (+) Transcript_5833:2863-3180(+)